jgi:hypothetical protein
LFGLCQFLWSAVVLRVALLDSLQVKRWIL